MNKASLLFIVLAVILLVLFTTKPSGTNQRDRILREQYQNGLDSIRLQYSPTIELNKKLTEKAFKDSVNYVEAKKHIKYLEQRLTYEKNNNRYFTNHAIDSLLAKVPSR